jgi:hypothetical protein
VIPGASLSRPASGREVVAALRSDAAVEPESIRAGSRVGEPCLLGSFVAVMDA